MIDFRGTFLKGDRTKPTTVATVWLRYFVIALLSLRHRIPNLSQNPLLRAMSSERLPWAPPREWDGFTLFNGRLHCAMLFTEDFGE